MSWLHSSWEKKVPGLHYSLLMQVCENYLLNNLQHILLLTAAPWCAQVGSWFLLFPFLRALLEARSHLLLRQHSSFQVPASTFLPTPASAAGKGFRKLGRSLLPPGHRLSNKSMCEKQNKNTNISLSSEPTTISNFWAWMRDFEVRDTLLQLQCHREVSRAWFQQGSHL